MTLQQLHYIVALDTHRHFVRAAESCFVSQPTLTLQVKKIENEIGLRIFNRSSQPIIPTSMGEKFIVQARQILNSVERLKEMVNQDRNELKGSFRLGIIPTLAPYLLPLFLKPFTDEYPEIYLEIEEMQSERIIEELSDNRLDLAILSTPLSEPHIREVPLFYEPFLLYAYKEDPILENKTIRVDDLHRKRLWLLKHGHCFRNQVLNLCKSDPLEQNPTHFSFESGSIETLKNMIQHHSGYTLIPEMSVDKSGDKMFTRRFEEPQPAREISLAVHVGFTKELLLTNLSKSIIKRVPHSFKKHKRFVTIDWK